MLGRDKSEGTVTDYGLTNEKACGKINIFSIGEIAALDHLPLVIKLRKGTEEEKRS